MTATTLTRPAATEFAPWYAGYIARVPEGDIIDLLVHQMHDTAAFLAGLTEAQGGHRYAPGKWSIREVIGHMADTERVFAYRAMRFARGDETPLPSFDENAWVAASGADRRSLRELAEEFLLVRQGTIALARSLTDHTAMRSGTASDRTVTVRALIYMTAGHELHHLAILRERYLA